MLQGLRTASQSWYGRVMLAIVMGFIVVSFAIWGIGDIFRGFGSGKLGQVGSVDISTEAYRSAYQNELQRIQRQARASWAIAHSGSVCRCSSGSRRTRSPCRAT